MDVDGTRIAFRDDDNSAAAAVSLLAEENFTRACRRRVSALPASQGVPASFSRVNLTLVGPRDPALHSLCCPMLIGTRYAWRFRVTRDTDTRTLARAYPNFPTYTRRVRLSHSGLIVGYACLSNMRFRASLARAHACIVVSSRRRALVLASSETRGGEYVNSKGPVISEFDYLARFWGSRPAR